MKDELVGGLFFAGGFGVLVTYAMLWASGTLPVLASYFSKMQWKLWGYSVLITVISALGIFVWYSFYEKLEDWKRDLFIASLCIFLGSAMIWSFSVEYIESKKANPSFQRPALFLTAFGTIGMLIAIAYSEPSWLLVTAASILVFHHLIVDGLIWPTIHQKAKIIHI